mmetsp:Transcript_20196/g.48460  ORF Transcript_20196/g.48460 Transcript_20196/m.48460 type:complete len:116 (+) Transcript_20196:484-831(+)
MSSACRILKATTSTRWRSSAQGNLKEFLKAEWALFLMFVKLIINIKRKEAEGNAFAQALHDGGTLTNKKKFQALALQFIAPKWQRNIVLTLALTKSRAGSSPAVTGRRWQSSRRS